MLAERLLRSFLSRHPKLWSVIRAVRANPEYGQFYDGSLSPHLELISDYPGLCKRLATEYAHKRPEDASVRLLDVGGRSGRDGVRNMIDNLKYHLLDIHPQNQDASAIRGDICSVPVIDGSFDFVHSHNVFEHIAEPWLACQEIGRILRPGGLCFTSTVFAWRYHPSPRDYWRFTHSALQLLFEKFGGMDTLKTGYVIDYRRTNFAGGKMENNLDGVPVDSFGGWLEWWIVIHIGQKPRISCAFAEQAGI